MTDLLMVCSPGGHFAEARALVDGLDEVDYKFVLHLPPELPPELLNRVIVAPHAERDIRVLRQLTFAIRCIWRERPRVIVSTGALIAVTFGLAGKLFGAHFIYVESPTRVNTPSLAARLSYYLADEMYVRHRPLLKFFPKAKYCSGER